MTHSETRSLIGGRFAPISLLGRGGMGEVWLARDPRSGGQLAVKTVSPEDSEGSAGVRHRREYLNLSRLRHPSIVGVNDYGIDPRDGARWFSSEVLKGPVSGQLAGHLSSGRWLEMCRAVLSPLAFLHRNGWVHGDIKSDNVRLRDPMCQHQALDPVLLDFGLSHRQGTECEQKILGTPHSMPPEQWLGEPPDSRGDVYSAGVLFYQLWCGRLPFPGNDRSRLGRAHLQDDPPAIDQWRPGLADGAIECLHKMLQKRPDDRPRDAGEVWNLLAQIHDGPNKTVAEETPVSLAAQVRYAGVPEEPARQLFGVLDEARDAGNETGVVIHVHRRGGDRRRITQWVRTRLMSDGVPVIAIDPESAMPLDDVSRELAGSPEVVVVCVEQPGLGSAQLQSAIECKQIGSCRIIWWINGSTVPSGYLGAVVAKRRTQIVQTDVTSAMELGDWLEQAIPGAAVPIGLRRRLDRWGQGSPAIWERVLIGRIEAGQLKHDGCRWCWRDLDGYPEDRWRLRVAEQAQRLSEDELSLVRALAVLREPAVPSDVVRVAGIDGGKLPSLAASLVQKRWIRIERDLHWCEPFQSEGVLSGIGGSLRTELHRRASRLSGLDPLEQARHQLSAGETENAANCLAPWLADDSRWLVDTEDLVEILTPMIDLLADSMKAPWAELLGRAEDFLGNQGRRDRAWRICGSLLKPDSAAAIRLARWRAHTTRRDGDAREALRILDEVSDGGQLSPTIATEEKTRFAIEYSRVFRTLARRGQAPLSIQQQLEDPQLYLDQARLERCRCALARGARLQAADLAETVIGQAHGDANLIAEAQCLLARSREDLRSLRIWSRLHEMFCRRSASWESAVVAGIESAESAMRLGFEALARTEISSLVIEARAHCRGQLPRALLLLARCEAGAGWIRGASYYLQEALTLDGPAGIVAWEGNLLVATSQWAAGRSRTAQQILQTALPEDAPHEGECIDVHSRHTILESRCVFSSGEPEQALAIIEGAITKLRLRGTARDLSALRYERVAILERLGHTAKAQTERRRISSGSIPEPGTDPEPSALRCAREALEARRLILLRRGDRERADRYLESAALDVLRLRAQPLSAWLTLERSEDLSSSERDQVACSTWKRVVAMESREGRAAVLLWWAKTREQCGDLESGSRLRQAALREVDRWQANSPPGTRWKELASLLGVGGLGSEALSGNGGRNAALA
ncbi:MAG: serine/threonine-protein kinase [Planctomycetota bacterium]|nr:serine/threonine-protein kinase [Planctomycetota bacterium]